MMTRKKIFYGLLIFLFVILAAVAVYLNSLLPIITGYAAKNLCSDVFISGRAPEDVEAADLHFSFIKYTHNKVNNVEKSVKSSFLWGRSKAIYREGFGVTLLSDISEENLRKIHYPSIPQPQYDQDTIAWPFGNILPDTVGTSVKITLLNEITKRLVTDNAYGGNPYAFMVLHKGIPVAEAYKPKFSRETRFLSWSMAKSFTNALVGIMVRQGKMDISKPAGIEEWKGDERSKITLNDLMQMQSGLEWNEDYGNRTDVTLMLHCVNDMGKFAYSKPSEYPAGTHWYYSSGSANIVSHLIRKQFDNDSSYYAFAENQFFNKVGMPDAEFEVDPSGAFVCSSYLYATARDYARFGLLYLNDGIFNGERILPEGWVKYTRTPASGSNGEYGAFFWLNLSKALPSAPVNMFYCDGHDGQSIYILPDEEMVVVVLGYSPRSNRVDSDRLLRDILSTL
jgi:CubicO group peptidase (beta-lactamase class C family)